MKAEKSKKPRRVVVVVTFDLHNVASATAVYARIQKDLANLKLKKAVLSKSGKLTDLPANTFVAVLKLTRLSDQTARGIRGELKTQVDAVIRSHHPDFTAFVVVGKSWAWATF